MQLPNESGEPDALLDIPIVKVDEIGRPATSTTRCPSCILTAHRALIAIASRGVDSEGSSSR
jgi:hypothetical protein